MSCCCGRGERMELLSIDNEEVAWNHEAWVKARSRRSLQGQARFSGPPGGEAHARALWLHPTPKPNRTIEAGGDFVCKVDGVWVLRI
eukprot:CAMPEP_0179262180 /NCGR_PEP_ID=MMETSP0797-20121207/27239_1 /TAXON_ID=47934 /ORGANISM="Dinophysis acuminata, Strain DAEP01" /LENGTH=86 /DNA_ID=CAMNT_0020970317 /DNA_START=49 /DNA_END=310 /DNA_ORIENTATION=-